MCSFYFLDNCMIFFFLGLINSILFVHTDDWSVGRDLDNIHTIDITELFFFGQGSGNFISREIGHKNYQEASEMASTGFFSALATGVLICVLGLLFLEPLAYLLGSTDTILPYTKAYLSVILLGAPWMTSSLVLNNQLRFQGSAAYAMVGITSGAVLNIGLDPLLIFALDLGIAGAAWATIISQFVGFCLLLIGCTKGGNLQIHLSHVKLKPYYYLWIFKGGLPSLARQGLASVATICLNQAARTYGDAAIAAMGVVQRIMMFGGSAMIGFGQGFQPVCGFNYGAGLYHRVKEGFWFSVKVTFVLLLAVSAAGFVWAPQLVSIFRDDPEVIAIGTAALRFQCVTFCLQSWVVMGNMCQQTMGLTVPDTVDLLDRLRKDGLDVPLDALTVDECAAAITAALAKN